jgi:hypothetical protein
MHLCKYVCLNVCVSLYIYTYLPECPWYEAIESFFIDMVVLPVVVVVGIGEAHALDVACGEAVLCV